MNSNLLSLTSTGIIGLGRVGTFLTIRLERLGYPVKAVYDTDISAIKRLFEFVTNHPETEPSALDDCSIVIVSVPDRMIDTAAETFLSTIQRSDNTILAHTSGMHQWNQSLLQKYPHILFGSIHPLMAFPPNPDTAAGFEEVGFCLTGQIQTIERLKVLVDVLGGYPFQIPEDKRVLYHAAAVFASNFPVLMHGMATDILSETGLDRNVTRNILTALLNSVVRNLAGNDPGKALSGPAARKDQSTINAHLTHLNNQFPEYAEIYRILTKAIHEWLFDNEMTTNT